MDDQWQVRYLPDWTVVEMQDGRIGYIGKGRGKQGQALIVLTADGSTGTQVAGDTEVRVIKYPAQMAQECLQQHNTKKGSKNDE